MGGGASTFVCRTLCLLLLAGAARSETETSISGFAGVMTNNSFGEALSPFDVEFTESALVGVGLRQEWPLFGSNRWFVGIEGQLVGHFGVQDHFEVNLPLVATYKPQSRLGDYLSRITYGIGLSFASKAPQVEIERDGASQNTLIYWMAELSTPLPAEDFEAFFRLHHRSDGFGLFSVDAGSNGLVLGLRRSF